MDKKLDILNREPFIQNLISFVTELSSKKQSYALAIEGEWGVGKTYVLTEFEKQLRVIQCEETADDKYYVFHYNCWQYDYYEEPSVAIVSAMLDQAEKESIAKIEGVAKASWKYAKDVIGEIAGEFFENKIGINPINIVNGIKENQTDQKENDREFDKMFSFKKTLENTRTKLETLSERKHIVFVVDELDRCLPAYAIKVLERMHHFFDGLSNVTVIYAVASSQLNQSIKSIYGDDIDVDKYLKKFINLQIELDNGNIQDSLFLKYESYLSKFDFGDEQDSCFDLFKMITDKGNIEIRTQERIMNKAEILHSMISSSHEEHKDEPALLIFEILLCLIPQCLKRTSSWKENLYWIPGINQCTYGGLEDDLGKELLDYLKMLEKSIAIKGNVQTSDGTFSSFNETASGIAFMCLDQILSVKKVYFVSDIEKYKDILEKCRSFRKYTKFVFR